MVIHPASDQGLLAGIHQDVVCDDAHHDPLSDRVRWVAVAARSVLGLVQVPPAQLHKKSGPVSLAPALVLLPPVTLGTVVGQSRYEDNLIRGLGTDTFLQDHSEFASSSRWTPLSSLRL